jgi:trimeric autotransporter adhesin
MPNPNICQAMTLGTVTPDAANPAGGSGFGISLLADSIVATPTAPLVLADLGTHVFEVEVDDAGNTTTVFVAIEVVTPEIDVLRYAAPIADGGTDTVTGAMASQAMVLTYDIENNGGADLSITNVVIANTVNCNASVTANPAGTVAPGSATTFQVTFTPGVGAFSFEIDIDNDDIDENPYDITVDGTAAAAPEIDVSRAGTPVADGATDDVGTLNTGVGNNVIYTITNSGTADLSVTGVNISAVVNCTASVSAAPAGTVAPAGSTTFTLLVTPATNGPFSFTISIDNDDADENPYDIDVIGTAQTSSSSGGGGGGGGGGCSAGSNRLPVVVLLLLTGVALLARRRRTT